MGPEALETSREDFKAQLKPFRGEIKGILTRGDFPAGFGNAHADEVLWTVRLHPYRIRHRSRRRDGPAVRRDAGLLAGGN
jgi:formamidopyrimidine-DNA glycosylase